MSTVKEQSKCVGCPLAAKMPDLTFVPPKMGPTLRLAVSEAPYQNKESKALNVIAGSDTMARSFASKAGFQIDSVSSVSCINCVTPENAFPLRKEARSFLSHSEGQQAVEHCRKAYLEPVLNSRPWERIDTFGTTATRAVTGVTENILKWRGSPLPVVEETKERVVPTLLMVSSSKDEPSAITQSYLWPAIISDLKKGTTVPPENYNLNPTVEEVESFVGANRLCFDIETNRWTGIITMVGLSTKPYNVTVVPFRGPYIQALKKVFASASELIGHNNVSFDVPVCQKNGMEFRSDVQLWDTMLMQHLLQPDMDHDLEFVSSIFTQKPAWKHLSSEDMALYCARDVDVTLQSYLQLRPTIEFQGLLKQYKYMQVPLAKMCKMMSDTGIRQDYNRLKHLRQKYLAELAEWESKLPDGLRPYDKSIKKRAKAPEGTVGKSGKPVKYISEPALERVVPYDSPKSLAEWLYVTKQFPVQRHRKTKKITTDKGALEKLYHKTHDEHLNVLLEVSRLSTLLTTSLKDDTNEVKQEVIHCNFLPHGTSTGRLSSSNPNLQNIPLATKYIFVPPHSDWCFIEADFASLENRLAAWFAQDEERLGRLYTPGFNEHRWLASKLFDKPEADLEKWEYKRGKNTNHGCDGAMGPNMLSNTYDVPIKDARDLIAKWKKINKKSADWQERTGTAASRNGVLTNPFGRKRWFWGYGSYTEGIRFLPQSTGADLCYRAMLSLVFSRIGITEEAARQVVPILSPLPKLAQLVLQVHDSLLVACPQALVPECVAAMNKAMSQPWPELGGLYIPATFSVGAPGSSWAELDPYTVEA